MLEWCCHYLDDFLVIGAPNSKVNSKHYWQSSTTEKLEGPVDNLLDPLYKDSLGGKVHACAQSSAPQAVFLSTSSPHQVFSLR